MCVFSTVTAMDCNVKCMDVRNRGIYIIYVECMDIEREKYDMGKESPLELDV